MRIFLVSISYRENYLNENSVSDRRPEDVRKGISRTTPLSRIAQPDDIAKTVAAIAGEGAQFLTGTYTPVNGGNSME
ncbi:SDR family oxidoreductase [Haladaptatus caseinilyticus]|uniref:SDR family oxidoreductase n=1 Tax=Haladaptatus caseinilyticus TaxID=2993314 RepID=UPI00224A54E9|nr:SDR family oxidoreductase [Haladaptatus caseinilyticus]